MNIEDFTLLEWQKDLGKMTVKELADWIMRQRVKAYSNNELNKGRLEQLYQEWLYLYETVPADLPEDMPEEYKTLFQNNQNIMRGKGRKKNHYRKAVLLLNTPIPRFRYRAKGDTHSIYIRHWAYRHNYTLSVQQALRQVEQEMSGKKPLSGVDL